MKKLLLILLASSVTSVYASELKSFDEIYNSLQEGNNIRMVINFDKCSPPPHVDNMLIYTTPTAVMMRKDYLQFANSPLTTNNPDYPKQPILQNVTYKMTNANEMTIVTRMFKLPDYNLVYEANSVCELGTGVRIFN